MSIEQSLKALVDEALRPVKQQLDDIQSLIRGKAPAYPGAAALPGLQPQPQMPQPAGPSPQELLRRYEQAQKAPPADVQLDYEKDVQPLIRKYAADPKTKAAVVDTLKAFNVKSGSGLTPEQLPKFKADLLKAVSA